MTTIINNIWDNKLRFFVSFAIVSFIGYGVLFIADIIPEPITSTEVAQETVGAEEVVANTRQETITATTPTLLIIDSLKKNIAINNPTSTVVDDLDTSLLAGAVRYPGTANMEQNSTMFLFGHSSNLAYVKNKNFQAFNDIEKLVWGDLIRIQSGSRENVYRVDRVYQQKASVASIDLIRNTQTLTLVTCNNFGSKDDRYVVEASLIGSRSI